MTTSTDLRYLEIYLDDHRALGVGGIELAERTHENLRDTIWSPQLTALVEQFHADMETLTQIRDAFGFDDGKVKGALALVGERLGRLKLNGHLVTESPLSPVVEVESLIAVARAKKNLWAALQKAERPELTGFDLPHVEKLAEDQLEVLESIHSDVARQAFAVSGD